MTSSKAWDLETRGLRPRAWVQPPPPQYQSILGVLIRAIYNHIIVIIQLLLRGGSTQPGALRLLWIRLRALDFMV